MSKASGVSNTPEEQEALPIFIERLKGLLPLRPASERPEVDGWIAVKWKDGRWTTTRWVRDYDFSVPSMIEGWLLLSRAEPKSLAQEAAELGPMPEAVRGSYNLVSWAVKADAFIKRLAAQEPSET